MSPSNVVTGRTRVVFMIGAPVAQARAPTLFNRYFQEAGADRTMTPLHVRPEKVAAFLDVLRGAEDCDGLVATIPLKKAVFAAIDRPSERAKRLGLVNVARREPDGGFAGDMTDGEGFWNAAAARGFAPAGRRIVVAGAGAAATAICDEFLRRGGAFVRVATPHPHEFAYLSRILESAVCDCEPAPSDLSSFDMAINATPIGMAHVPGSPFLPAVLATLPTHALVADAITHPVETQLLLDARARGLPIMTGEDMTDGAFRAMGSFLGVL